jgi:uncharacterized repeat protein (TIGR03803 family)
MPTSLRLFQTHILGMTLALMILCSIQAAAVNERILHEFSGQQHGAWPNALVSDSSGDFFGTTEDGGANNFGAVYEFFPTPSESWTQKVLYSFSGGTDGGEPFALAVDVNDNVYGLTQTGGTGSCNQGCGTAFELTRNSNGDWVKTTIYDFQATDGYPYAQLLVYKSGNLYGASSIYSNGEYLSIFELTPSGGSWTESTLYTLYLGNVATPAVPGLVFDSSGNIYGTVSNTATATQGLVFELTPSSGSWTETTLYTFPGGASGSTPTGNLLLQDGNLYGVTSKGGIGYGVVFELIPGVGGQWNENALYSFQGIDSDGMVDPAVSGFDSSGNLYGFTEGGGAGLCPYCGSIFQLVPNGNGSWTETDLWDFVAQDDGPTALVVTAAGQLYGTNLGPDVFPTQGKIFELAQVNGTWRIRNLYKFPWTDGQWPSPGLIADSAGNFYGTTGYGGSNNVGSIFEVSPVGNGWKESLLYSFGPISHQIYFSAGPSPLASDGQGNYYGTTELGGAKEKGSVFELSPKSDGGWQETDLYSFDSESLPIGGVVFDKAGNIYGVTGQGGAQGSGMIFQLTKNVNGAWHANEIYTFAGYPTDGANPQAGLTMDAAGNLYGTTEFGGSAGCIINRKTKGCGTVFELSYSADTGWTETILHSFAGEPGSDGASPAATLIWDSSGNLYGTTLGGGTSGNGNCSGYGYAAGCGTVFELSPSPSGWNETVLYGFQAGKTDGASPYGGLVWDQSGDLYGTLDYSAAYDFGALFKLTPTGSGTWTENLIYSFGSSSNDGRFPVGTLLLGASGKLYGVTAGGGVVGGVDNNGQGTVFEIKP